MTGTVDGHAAAITIAQKNTDCRNVRKLGEQGAVVFRGAPRKNDNADDRLERRGFILHSEIPGEEAVFVRVDRLHGPFPRTNLFLKHAANVRDGMEVEMASDMFVAEPGTKEKRRCMERAASADDGFAANAHAVALF